jgi:hypothetical protein
MLEASDQNQLPGTVVADQDQLPGPVVASLRWTESGSGRKDAARLLL